MKPGQASQTAVLVCAARAMAHERQLAPGFADPTAFELLPEQARQRVIEFRKGAPKGVRERFAYEFMTVRAAMMAVRTLFIDEALREAEAKQLVILGAGLDGRAWRMPELRDAVVFEVDHPDSQSYKRSRVAGLEQVAREVRFVPVDFSRDDLARSLVDSGYDPGQATTWIWEGVVMYLTPAEVEATLDRIASCSAPGSRLIIIYIAPGRVLLRLVGLMVRRMGEPFRSTFTEQAMRRLLEQRGFRVLRDEDLPAATARLAPALARLGRRVGHMRLVSAALGR